MNPAEEFLTEKKAFGLGALTGAARSTGKAMSPAAKAFGSAAAVGAGAAAFAGLAGGASKLYAAATKTRDFRAMLDANPDLLQHQKADPAGFNRMYSSLRTLAPEFAAEPLVAGYYLRQGMEGLMEGRGGVSVQAMNAKRPVQTGPMTDAALQGYMRGMGSKKEEGPRPQLVSQTRHRFDPETQGWQQTETTENRYG